MRDTKDSNPGMSYPEQAFRRQWRRWLDLPVRMSGHEAAERILRESHDRRNPADHGIRIWISAGTVTALLLVSVFLYRQPVIPPLLETSGLDPAGISEESAILKSREVLMWLDEKTPLYMTFEAPKE